MAKCDKRIFISYSTHQLGLARDLRDRLQANCSDIVVFLADDSIEDGQPLEESIFDALLEADGCFVLWDDHAAESDWVLLETTLAYGLGMRTITIRIESVTAVPWHLRAHKYIDVRQCGGPVDAVVRAVDSMIQAVGAHSGGGVVDVVNGAGGLFEEDSFYEHGRSLLGGRRADTEDLLFVSSSGTPALLLPSEDFTFDRHEYVELLIRRLRQPNRFCRTHYLFDFSRAESQIEAERLRNSEALAERAKVVLPALVESPIRVLGLRDLALPLPSALLGPRSGALILRNPRDDRFIGIRFVAGVQLESLRRRLYSPSRIGRKSLVVEGEWTRRFGLAAA